VIRQLKLTPVYFRYHPGASEEVLLKAIEPTVTTAASPAS
jgi:hypothetical protein